MIMFHCGQNGAANVGLAELIFPAWVTVDGNEKPTLVGNPLGNGVRQSFPDGRFHTANISNDAATKSIKRGARTPLRAEATTI
jgi:hypothetical protein